MSGNSVNPINMPGLGRRTFLSATLGIVAAAGLTGCASAAAAGADSVATKSGASGSLPTAVPPGTTLSIGDTVTQVAIQASHISLPFTAEWQNLLGGPEILQAFRANALDIGTVGGIPPIQALATGLDVKIVAIRYRDVPAYELATAPHSSITKLSDIKGKKIGFSAGQEQGLFVLEALKQVGLTKSDVTLVPLTSSEFQNSLESNQIDAAPISEPTLTIYLDQFGKEGARALKPDLQATPDTLTVPTSVLSDKSKEAAVVAYVKAWYKANVWEWENTAKWIRAYYVENQHVTTSDGKRIVAELGIPKFPYNFNRSLKIEHNAMNLLAAQGITKKVDVTKLFDDRFAPIASQVVAKKYLEE